MFSKVGEYRCYEYYKKQFETHILYTGKISPPFIFALFVLWPEGELKTGLIELCGKGLYKKIGGGRIQDWANQGSEQIRLG